MRFWLLVLFLSMLVLSTMAVSQSMKVVTRADEPTDAEIRELIRALDDFSAFQSVFAHQIPKTKRAFPDYPQEFWDKYSHFMDSDSAFLEIVVPLYRHHFTSKEVKEITKFYKTKTGQKLVKEIPSLTQESSKAIVEMQMRMMEDLVRSMGLPPIGASYRPETFEK